MIEFKFDAEPLVNSRVKSLLVVHSYPNDLYLSWVLEYVNEIRSADKDIKICIFDIGTYAWHKESHWKSKLRRFLHRTQNNSIKIFEHFSNALSFDLEVKKRKILNELQLFIKFFFHAYTINSVEELLSDSFYSKEHSWSVHSSLVNRYWSIFYIPKKHAFQVALRALSFKVSYMNTLDILITQKFDQVVVCNGRLPNSAGAAQAAKDKSIPVKFIERGGTPGMFNVFNISPHSMRERFSNCVELWNSSVKNNRFFAETVAKSYINLRSNFDPIAGISWSRQMTSMDDLSTLIPKTRKYMCVFYTSTEFEFAVYGDYVSPGQFRNQREALNALLQCLSNEWQIIIRRHPQKLRRNWLKRDPEQTLWQGLESDPRIIIVQPESTINSYDLALNADLVCHFNSSIGAEIMFLNSVPVISLGETYWDESPEFALTNFEKLSNWLRKFSTKNQQERALRWGLYSAIAGKPFKIIKWKNQRGFIFNQSLFSKELKKELLSKKTK